MKLYFKVFLSFVILLYVLVVHASEEARLTVSDGMVTRVYTTSELLARPDLVSVTIPRDISYKRTQREYKAIKLANLFKGLKIDDEAMIQFYTTDNFSSAISKRRLLNESSSESIAYLAVEDPAHPWLPMPLHKQSPGPFYLIWLHPERSKISQEEWPFMLAGFMVIGSLAQRYPAIMPDSNISKHDPIYRGFETFAKQCFACHTMNGQGSGTMGPDLNVPMNPTQYFTEEGLKRLIRSPKSVRTWPTQIMQGFSQQEISDQEMDNLILYLKSKAERS